MLNRLLQYLETLKFPRLLVITAALLVVDLIVPDLIPFADELLLAGVTLLLGQIRKQDTGSPDQGGSP